MYAKVLRILQLRKSILLYDNLKSEKKFTYVERKYVTWQIMRQDSMKEKHQREQTIKEILRLLLEVMMDNRHWIYFPLKQLKKHAKYTKLCFLKTLNIKE